MRTALVYITFAISSSSYCQTITTIVNAQNLVEGVDTIIGRRYHLGNPTGISIDDSENLLVSDYTGCSCIYKLDRDSLILHKIAKVEGPGGAHGITVDNDGNIYYIEYEKSIVRKVSKTGVTVTYAGNGYNGYRGDNGPATSAQLNLPNTLAVDKSGNLYIADQDNHVIRKVDQSGIITTVAGSGISGYGGDGGLATQALLNRPYGVAVNLEGCIYISDTYNGVIRKVDLEGKINTIAGTSEIGYSGDGGPASKAQLNTPCGLAIDGDGVLYIADEGSHVVRKITTDGSISTIAGTGIKGYKGDNGPANKSLLYKPIDLAVDKDGNLYIDDFGNHVIRKVMIPKTDGEDFIKIWITTDEKLGVKIECGNYTSLTITNADGKEFYHQQVHSREFTVDVKNLITGYYFVNFIKTNSITKSLRFVIER